MADKQHAGNKRQKNKGKHRNREVWHDRNEEPEIRDVSEPSEAGGDPAKMTLLRDILFKYISDNKHNEKRSTNLLRALLSLESEQKVHACLYSLFQSLKNA
ncbi:MAG: hypothetical protein AB2L14_31890 [Candidatus Xenobiia bacterium LiM19]